MPEREIKVQIPEDLAEEAEELDLLSPQALVKILRDTVDRAAMDMVNEEIQAYRREKAFIAETGEKSHIDAERYRNYPDSTKLEFLTETIDDELSRMKPSVLFLRYCLDSSIDTSSLSEEDILYVCDRIMAQIDELMLARKLFS